MLIFTRKGEKEREVAKLALIPGCFGINEPVIFWFADCLEPVDVHSVDFSSNY